VISHPEDNQVFCFGVEGSFIGSILGDIFEIMPALTEALEKQNA
jgi:hypothetical protein